MTIVEGKVALVTGGTGGIGSAMVKALLQNGAKGVSIVDISEVAADPLLKEIEESFGPHRAIFIKTDVTDATALEEAFEGTVRAFGHLDIVVNNAGIIDEVTWEKTIAVNLISVIRGSFLAMEKYLPRYRSGEEGVIVNTGSILGLNTIQCIPVYCASKHGVVSLGEALGGDEYYKRYKVRVLTICPGVVKTALLSGGFHNSTVSKERRHEELHTLNEVFQRPEFVGKALIKAIEEGRNGSLWVTEEEKPPYEVEKPHRNSMKKC